MTSMTQRVEGILEESRKVEFLPTLQLWIAAVFFALCWCVGKIFVVLWRAVTFVWTACVVGFKTGMGKGG